MSLSVDPFVRQYETTDLKTLNYICQITAEPILVEQAPDKGIISGIWCTPYPKLEPQSCFVLDDGKGKAVGYIVGSVDTKQFIGKYQREYIPTIDPERFPPPTTEAGDQYKKTMRDVSWMLDTLYNPNVMDTELMERYPAHFHIDIIPEHQSKGYGPQLLKMFFDHVKKAGSHGVHVGMAPNNDRAGVWYERHGFERKNVERGGRWMVKDL